MRLNDVLGDQTCSVKGGARTPPHAADDDAPKTAAKENGCWTLLRNWGILTRFCEVDSITHEIILSLGRVQLEVVSASLSEKYKLETVKRTPSFIWSGRSAASHTIHIEVLPNPFWASIGLSVTPLPRLACTIREPGFAGILEPEFSKRCQGWYPLRAGAGLVRLERNGL